MEHLFFSKSFSFRTILHRTASHTDNSLGISTHFLAKMRQGSGIIRTSDGNELHLTAGDCFYLPLDLSYHSYWTPEAEGSKTVAWDSYGFLYFPVSSEDRYEMQCLPPIDGTDILWEQLAADQTISPTSVGTLYLLLGRYLPYMKPKNADKRDLLFRRAREYLTQFPDCRIVDLAKHCRISESGLYAFFREYANTTPVREKHRIKTEQAIRLLETTDRPIEEISAMLGFCSAAYFRKVVKEQTGRSPSVIRKERRGRGTL